MSQQPSIKVAVTGAAGQISYSLLFRLAAGEVFGANQPVELHLIELPAAMKATEGVAMELNDCAYPTLTNIQIFDNPKAGFDGVHWALLVGSMPRTKGMQRGDLVKVNGPIFKQQGQALEAADASLRCIVVGNPCNTNALIALSHAPSIPSRRFLAMTALDEKRAQFQLAQKCGVPVSHIKNLIIWGNHSTTMVPDYENAQLTNPTIYKKQWPHVKIAIEKSQPQTITTALNDNQWLSSTFISEVQHRGMKIIQARGKSSAASAASACIDTIKNLINPSTTPFSAGIFSNDNPYNIDNGLVFSFPLTIDADGEVQIAPNFSHSPEMRKLIEISMQELIAEKAAVKALL